MSDPAADTSAKENCTPYGAPAETKTSNSTFVFGQNSSLTGQGFGSLQGQQVAAGESSSGQAAAKTALTDEAGEPFAGEEDCSQDYAPVVQLEEVQTTTGEEEEEVLFESKSKLYRFDQDVGEWKERGVGVAKLLKDKNNGRVRFLMREDKTLKIRGNHLVIPGTKLQNHAGNSRAIVWQTVDFADEEQKIELFCLRFGSDEKASQFCEKYEEAMVNNKELLSKDEETNGGENKASQQGTAAEKGDATKESASKLADDLQQQAI
eukprot:TRINITY_DN25663_c0_g1_i1.p2 TRINITY_DN25663_c0_g1~~TRINITY_DN25663_c0_g1_i1.p2  ORF type:complete len:264 (-),score=47.30 TRINITY_DN25663_c0_g1_i1:411-1202(-)